MAKLKLGKVFTAIAVVGGVIAGGILLYKKYISIHESLDDDFEDFEDDFEDEDLDFEEKESTTPPKREYVSINLENEKKIDESEIVKEEVKEEEEEEIV